MLIESWVVEVTNLFIEMIAEQKSLLHDANMIWNFEVLDRGF